MRTKNAAPINKLERAHLERVKQSGCAVCGDGPFVEAHHIVQGDHFTVLGLCTYCHTSPQGIHGDQSAFRRRFKAVGERGELLALNETLSRVAALGPV